MQNKAKPAARELPLARVGQGGQALVEFTLILPLLLILSFGTLEIGLYLQRQLIAGGAAYVAARAAAVQGPSAEKIARQVLATYAQDTQFSWLGPDSTTLRAKLHDSRQLQVTVAHQGDAWSGLLAGAVQLTGGQLTSLTRWQTALPISQEFVSQANSSRHAAREPTDLMVDYRATVLWPGALPNFSGILAKLPGSFSDVNLRIALDPTAQAALANPQDRQGTVSPSKKYVGSHNEDRDFAHAGKLATGIGQLKTATEAFYGLYAAAPGGPVYEGLRSVAQGFATANGTLKFAETANNSEHAMHVFYGARSSR
ncbi:MAG: pilus assembly protein [Cyanobacteria bacterium NC_groundwater_1444_Ag_S-0.65um_54_12]|nr:pilus assembly protein [Cyanobacteria bacterium NC_groundwater_1444_Ag_S-0.65um_54_12]